MYKLESIKHLFQVFTSKMLFIEWLLQLLRAITLYFLKIKAGMKSDIYAEENETIDLRHAPKYIKDNIVYDSNVLDMRWDLCLGCEFLTESNKCEKCGCFMKAKHMLKSAKCPIGKWDIYKEDMNVIRITA